MTTRRETNYTSTLVLKSHANLIGTIKREVFAATGQMLPTARIVAEALTTLYQDTSHLVDDVRQETRARLDGGLTRIG